MKSKILRIAFGFLLSLSTIVCYSQKQNFVWHFGATGAGLDFSNCNPSVLTNGINNGYPFEGQSSISDNGTGKLLFYTDGFNIYDSTNSIMQNGYNAGLEKSMTQTIIIKKPNSSSLFYMFTPDMQAGLVYNSNYPNSKGINYATVDMTLNSGLGAVTSVFNSLKQPINCEKLTAVYHSNGQDIWLIGHEYGNSKFFSYLITSTGIDTVPIISNVGPVIYTWQNGTQGASNFDAIGELKATTSGTKVVFTSFYNGTTCLCDFNKSTGIITNPIPLTIEAGGYGVSFSQDNSKLYISGVDTSTGLPYYPTNGKIYQFDISSNNQTTIQNSRTTIYTDPTGGFRSIKLGVDGKIYVARIDSTGNGDFYLGIISNPNNAGLACNYSHTGIYLNGLRGRWGLNNAIEDSTVCIPSDISEVENEKLISIYPNPFSQTLYIAVNNHETEEIILYDIFSQKLLQKKLTNSASINTEQLAKGIYLYEVRNKSGVIKKGKVVKD